MIVVFHVELHVPVILATQEAEMGKSPEARRGCSQPGNRAVSCSKKKGRQSQTPSAMDGERKNNYKQGKKKRRVRKSTFEWEQET